MLKTDPPIIVKQDFNCSVSRLWTAITDASEMRKWMFEQIQSYEPVVNFETSFDLHHEGRLFRHMWKILEVEANHLIKTNWTFEGYPGQSIVSFEISPTDDGSSMLTVTAIALEDFPQDIPEFKRESGLGGWNFLLKESLKDHLENDA